MYTFAEGIENLKGRWRQLRPRTRHWMANIFIGVLIELLLHVGHHFHVPWIETNQNIALDAMMRGSAETVRDDDPPGARLAFIDVDSRTWRHPSWGGGEPDIAPRDRVAQLVEYAFLQGARLVVLDIMVEGRPNAADQAFAAKIANIVGQPGFRDDGRLVLVRSIRHPLDGEDGVPMLRESALDPVVARFSERIQVAAPYFKISRDLVLRDWELWSLACKRNEAGEARWTIVPSVQLLVARDLLTGKPATSRRETAFCDHEGSHARGNEVETIRSLNAEAWQWVRELAPEAEERPDHEHALANRIGFHIGDPPRLGQLRVISAIDVLHESDERSTRAAGKASGAKPLQDAIVIIGQSYPEAHDRHATPLGDMAGSIVLANSIDSMVRHGLLHEPSPWLRFCIALCAIVIVGYLFARWDSLRGTAIALVIVIGALVILSYQFFKFGIWLDFALPLIGIQLHRLVKRYEENSEYKRLAQCASPVDETET